MDVKNTHSVTKTEISVFGRQALAAERRRSPSLADKVLTIQTGERLYLTTNNCIDEEYDCLRHPILFCCEDLLGSDFRTTSAASISASRYYLRSEQCLCVWQMEQLSGQ